MARGHDSEKVIRLALGPVRGGHLRRHGADREIARRHARAQHEELLVLVEGEYK